MMSKASRKQKQKMEALSNIMTVGGEPENVVYSDERRALAKKTKLIKVKKKSVILMDEDGMTIAHLTLDGANLRIQAAHGMTVDLPKAQRNVNPTTRRARVTARPVQEAPGAEPADDRKVPVTIPTTPKTT